MEASSGAADIDRGQLLSAVLESIPSTSVIVFDSDLRVVLATGRALIESGYSGSAPAEGQLLAEILPSPIYDGLEPYLLAALAGVRRSAEYTSVAGNREYWLSTATLRGEGGEPVAGIAIMVDVTDRVKARRDRNKFQAQLVQTQRLEAIGKLAGGVAHDFNNMLAVVLNCADFVAEALPDESPATEDVVEIQRAVERGTALTRQLLLLSDRELASPTPVDLNSVLAHMEKLLRRTLGAEVELRVDPLPGLWQVVVDSTQIEQVLLGMALNAADAMPQGGRLTIATENLILNRDFELAHAPVAPGPWVLLSVSDTGTGIEPGNLGRIFDPFFSTKPRSGGSGLGLAAAHGVVSKARGHIAVRSEPGEGATFNVYLPALVVSEEDEDEHGKGGGEAFRVSGRAILVAEDDPALRRMVVRTLERAGCLVTAAEDGQAALELLTPDRKIDLLLADVIMPRLSGPELAERATILRPELPVLFMSGYAEDFISERDLLSGDVELLKKPFAASELIETISRSMARAQSE